MGCGTSKESEKQAVAAPPEKPQEEEVATQHTTESPTMASAQNDNKQQEEQFEHQTAGHAGSMLKQGKDKIMKPVSNNELSFYEGFYRQYPAVQQFAPKYYGFEKRDGKTYIIMEDLTSQFRKPCILDIKMGTSSVGEDASPEKKAAMRAKDESTTTVSLGIRICGFRAYQKTKTEYVTKDKSYGKKVTDSSFQESLALFFFTGESYRKKVVDAFIKLLEDIYAYFDSQRDLRFYSSSLLFLFEGDEDDHSTGKVDLRMIDFAHVHPINDGGKDDGYILGLKNLIQIMKNIRDGN